VIQHHPHRSGTDFRGKLVRRLAHNGSILFGSWSLRQTRGGSLWSESYLDDGNRWLFNNASLTGLFLDFEGARSAAQYDTEACMPVLREGLQLYLIHGRVALRAQEMLLGSKAFRLQCLRDETDYLSNEEIRRQMI
jgi:hypothetical protein